MMRFTVGVLAYAVPTFALGYAWHLILFESYYDALAIYRDEIIVPFGFLAIFVQGGIFAWIYEKAFAQRNGGLWSRALSFGVTCAMLSWTFTTLAVAAKNIMTSVPDYLVIETAFTVVQWAMVAPLVVLAFRLGTSTGSGLHASKVAR